MAQNISPIFPLTPDNQFLASVLTTANTAMDGTGTVVTGYTADATNGSMVNRLIIRPLGTNAATVIRVFENNGSTNVTATNNSLIAEIPVPATTASNTAAQSDFSWPINLALPPGHKLNFTIGTSATAGFAITTVAAKF